MKIDRRHFVRQCLGVVAAGSAAAAMPAGAGLRARSFERVQLVDGDRRPLRASELTVGDSYLFHYPYQTTPCFLVDLGRPALPGPPLQGDSREYYEWQGGVGRERSIVAFSAICAHRMTHPARNVSFINYRHEPVPFPGDGGETRTRGNVIYCCSERSVYDAADGARVLGGPAPMPLAAIVLDWDADEDALYATGTQGSDLFDQFFLEFGFRLALEHNTAAVDARVRDEAITVPIREYCAQVVLC